MSLIKRINLFAKKINIFFFKARIKTNITSDKSDELNHQQLSYAQDGEDLVLDRLFEYKKSGFYIDVGAHHPSRFSNTYLFYKRGWRGINIDAQPGSMKAFNIYRQRDINIECGIGLNEEIIKYYQFNEPALNTFNQAEAVIKNKSPYFIVGTQFLKVHTLKKILNENIKDNQEIDFITIDVEGNDLEVLESNDWIKYRPKYILAETLRTNLSNIGECPLVQYLDKVGYVAICKVYNTTFFERND